MRVAIPTLGKKSKETIADIMAPINAITAKLKAFQENAEAEAQVKDEESRAAEKAAFELREQAAEAKRLAEKYS